MEDCCLSDSDGAGQDGYYDDGDASSIYHNITALKPYSGFIDALDYCSTTKF